MFLDPMRNSKGCMDFFVFADNHRRLQYGEHRIHTARMDPKFRPSVGGLYKLNLVVTQALEIAPRFSFNHLVIKNNVF
jgi:hypothetical protein